MKSEFHRHKIEVKMIENEEIQEIRLNQIFFKNDDMQSLINQGFQASYMTDEELSDKDVIYEIWTKNQ